MLSCGGAAWGECPQHGLIWWGLRVGQGPGTCSGLSSQDLPGRFSVEGGVGEGGWARSSGNAGALERWL